LLHGDLLRWDNAWSDFVLQPGGGVDAALAQRGHDLAHPDARTVAELRFAEATGFLRSLAAHLTAWSRTRLMCNSFAGQTDRSCLW